MPKTITTLESSSTYEDIVTASEAVAAAVIKASASNTGNVYIRRKLYNYADPYPLAAGETYIADYVQIKGGLEASSDNGTESIFIMG